MRKRKKGTKFLIIGPTPPPYYGVSIATKNILDSNLQRRFKLVHLNTADRRSLSNIGRIDFRNIYLAFLHFLKFLWLCIKERPKVVYIPISQGILGYLRDCLFIIPATFLGSKVIVHLHGSYFRKLYEKSNILFKILIRSSLKKVSCAIVLGKSLRYIFEGLIPEERIVVVSNGIDENLFKDHNTDRIKKEKRHYKIIFLSYLAKSKGFFDIIEAIPEVLQYYIDAEFYFAGEFWLTEAEKRKVDYIITIKELDQNIKFQGTVIGNKKADFLLSSDIFVLPSYNEGQPLVIIEAMAAGLPIITTDTGTIKEMVIDGENGFIVKKKTPKEIAEKIIILLEDEKLRREMGQKSRERFLKYYTKDKFISNLAKVFGQVLSNTHQVSKNI